MRAGGFTPLSRIVKRKVRFAPGFFAGIYYQGDEDTTIDEYMEMWANAGVRVTRITITPHKYEDEKYMIVLNLMSKSGSFTQSIGHTV